ncbi:MAG: glycerol-3-phosphate cytidylyltransferase [Endozoicomonadaceae bacterium]|nr:glycerol-3-phosphate cytidylyltransferase [Endozoicomonadaceae bacterium]
MEKQVRTVITYGTFDLFHIGHLKILQRAKMLGDRLIVGISTDDFNLKKNKKTVIPYHERAEIISNIRFVDDVLPESSWEQKSNDIIQHNVDIFVMGHDWEGKFDFLSEYCEVTYLPRTKGISTTKIKTHLQQCDGSRQPLYGQCAANI